MPTSNVGSITYDARITTAQLKKDAREVENITADTAKNVGNNLDKSESRSSALLGSVVGKVKVAALATVAAIGAASVATATFGIKSAADLQQTRIGLENMLGSADKARSLLTDISKFAADTPFQFPELAQATRQLVAFGFTGEEAFSTMKQLGDVSAAVGSPINDLAYLMGTLRTQGRAFTVDIRQFAQRGVPIYEYLAKVLGTNEKAIAGMIEEGKIGFPEVQRAFQAMTAEGGKFHGTMEKQSKSLSGIFSTLKDNIGQTVREMVGITTAGDIKPGSIMDFLLKGGSTVIENLPKIMEKIGKGVEALKGSFNDPGVTDTGFLGFLEKVGSTSREIFDYLQPKLETLWKAIQASLPTYKEYLQEVLLPLAGTLGKGLIVAIGLALLALAGLVKIGEVMLKVWKNVYVFFTETLPTAITNAWNFIITKALWLKDNFWSIVGEIIGFFATLPIKLPLFIAAAIVEIVSKIASVRWSDVFSSIWQGMQVVWDKVIDIIVNAWHIVHDLKWGDLFTGIGKSFANGLIALIEGALKGALKGLPGNIESKVNLPRFANGTNFAPGGPAIVGERGMEIVDLPRGSRVIPNHDLDKVGTGDGTNVTINLNMTGIMARSKADERDIAKSFIRTINEELQAKGQPLIAGGAV